MLGLQAAPGPLQGTGGSLHPICCLQTGASSRGALLMLGRLQAVRAEVGELGDEGEKAGGQGG